MNPFTQRSRISDPRRFVGRWRELSVIFDRLEAGRPVLIAGIPGIGKSSLLTHTAQSAAVNLETPELEAFYLDLAHLEDAGACYNLIAQALGSRGTTAAAVDVALLACDSPVLLCLDRADAACAAGWGSDLLATLARIARQRAQALPASPPVLRAPLPDLPPPVAPPPPTIAPLLLVVAVGGPAPDLSEPFATLGLGAFAPAEVRLFTDAYLDGTGVQFTPGELRELTTLSVGHPAYLQRAAFHLFRAHTEPDYDWRAAYFAEARERPVPGAPLPPAVFSGDEAAAIQSFYGAAAGQTGSRPPERLQSGSLEDLLMLLPLLLALLAWQFSGNWLVGGGTLLLTGLLLVGLRWLRARTAQR